MSESPPFKNKRLLLSLKRKSSSKERFSICSTEELKTASKKAVPKNTTTAVNWAFRVFCDWVQHSHEVEGRSYTVQDLWRHDQPERVSERYCRDGYYSDSRDDEAVQF